MTASRSLLFAFCFSVASVFAVVAVAGPNPGGKKPVPTYKVAQKPVEPAKVRKVSAQKSTSKSQKAARSPGMNCVQYVRSVSDVELSGDGWMWWDRAEDRYERGKMPQPGAVMVFKRTPSMVYGHIAVVSEVVDERNIRVNHANWAPRGGLKGRVETGVMVQDISDDNDWSLVRVWYDKVDQFGKPYPVAGFVYSPSGGAPTKTPTIEAKPTNLVPAAYPVHPDLRNRGEMASREDVRSNQVAQQNDWAADRRSN